MATILRLFEALNLDANPWRYPVAAWPKLPEAIRPGIVAMVKANARPET